VLCANLLPDLARTFPGTPCLVIDNGKQGLEQRANHDGFDMTVETPDANLGVAGSWNRIMRWGFEELGVDYCLILNDDLTLNRPRAELEAKLAEWGYPLLVCGYMNWGVFLIHRRCRDIVGEFDEQFNPGKYEDADYAYRFRLAFPAMSRWTARSKTRVWTATSARARSATLSTSGSLSRCRTRPTPAGARSTSTPNGSCRSGTSAARRSSKTRAWTPTR